MTNNSKTKLHEILAVEASLNEVLANAVKEATSTFAGKDHLFKGHIIKAEPLSEDTSGHQAIAEEEDLMDVSETVTGKLEFVLGHLVKAFNVYGRKERTNQSAKADLKIGSMVLIKDAPATMLLGLETRLKLIRAMIDAVKTSDQSKGWIATQTKDVWQARPEVRQLTKKVQRHEIVIEPTEHQPGQFASYGEDVRVGVKTTVHLTGLVSPATKSEMLGRVDTLLRATRKARQRANGQEVDTKFSPGSVIKKFILSGVVPDDAEE